MVRRLTLTAIALALLLGAGASQANDRYAFAEQCDSASPPCFLLESTIAFASTRDYPDAVGPEELFNAGEIYLMDRTNRR